MAKNVNKEQHLSKDEELALGALVQKAIRAKEAKSKATKKGSMPLTFEMDGEVLSEAELEKVLKDGERATNKLVTSNTSLVWDRARKFKAKYPAGPELEDLAQEGQLGLTRAIYKYDPSRGNKLSTVAVYWIDQAITRGTNNTGRLVRLPENRIQAAIDMNAIRKEYEDSDLTTDQVDQIIMERMKLRKDKFINIKNAASQPISLNRPVGTSYEGESKELMDFIADENMSESSEEQVTNSLMVELLYEKLALLTDMEKEVISAAFLIGASTSEKRASMSEVREAYNITPQKFKRVLNNALGKIRNDLEGLGMDFSDFIG